MVEAMEEAMMAMAEAGFQSWWSRVQSWWRRRMAEEAMAEEAR